jgi:hypothetical protein
MLRKTCNKCKIEKDIDEFHKRSDTKDGLTQQCKTCNNERRRNYYKENRETQLQQAKEYHKKKQERMQQIAVKARSRKRKDGDLEKERKKTFIIEVMALIADDWKCRNCQVEVHFQEEKTITKAYVEMIVPAHLGGISELSNLQTLCRSCKINRDRQIQQTFTD